MLIIQKKHTTVSPYKNMFKIFFPFWGISLGCFYCFCHYHIYSKVIFKTWFPRGKFLGKLFPLWFYFHLGNRGFVFYYFYFSFTNLNLNWDLLSDIQILLSMFPAFSLWCLWGLYLFSAFLNLSVALNYFLKSVGCQYQKCVI